jgi:hypothetical protein
MIVKVQISIITSGKYRSALIYSKDSSRCSEIVASEDLLKLMGDELKKYFYATIENDKFVLGNECTHQHW